MYAGKSAVEPAPMVANVNDWPVLAAVANTVMLVEESELSGTGKKLNN